MSHVDQILQHRQHRVSRALRQRSFVISIGAHLALVAVFVALPALFYEAPKPIEAVSITVVPPKALGTVDPTPPPTEEIEPEPAPPPPPPPPPEKEVEPPPPDRPVLVETRKKPDPTPPPPPPPPARVTPPPPKRTPPPPPANPMARRQGSPFGNPVGASTSEATVGVEDPNFTYGYYLDRVVAVISENWTRPPIGVTDTILHFRILSDGTVVDLEVRRSSGDASFDLAAKRAVEASAPLPPLPKGYKREFLGINLIVK